MIAIFINFWKWEVDISIEKKSLTINFKVYVSKIFQFSKRKSVSRYKSHFEEFSWNVFNDIEFFIGMIWNESLPITPSKLL
jgi:hypothetical protein